MAATGTVRLEQRAAGGVELLLDGFEVLSRPAAPYPLNMADRSLKATLGTNLEYRTVALRHPRERAVFRIMEGIENGFRAFMLQKDVYKRQRIDGMGSPVCNSPLMIMAFICDVICS